GSQGWPWESDSETFGLRLAGTSPSLKSLPTFGRVVQNVTDVDYIHLPPQTFVGGINADRPSIAAEARMQIDPVLACKIGGVLSRRFQLGQGHKELRRSMI